MWNLTASTPPLTLTLSEAPKDSSLSHGLLPGQRVPAQEPQSRETGRVSDVLLESAAARQGWGRLASHLRKEKSALGEKHYFGVSWETIQYGGKKTY